LIIIENEDVSKIVSYVEIGQADIAILDSASVKNFFDNHYVRKDGTLKPIFQTNPLHMCLNGIMIPQEQHKLAKWLQAEISTQRLTEGIVSIEKDLLKEYANIIVRL
jgi:hypothetical protein